MFIPANELGPILTNLSQISEPGARFFPTHLPDGRMVPVVRKDTWERVKNFFILNRHSNDLISTHSSIVRFLEENRDNFNSEMATQADKIRHYLLVNTTPRRQRANLICSNRYASEVNSRMQAGVTEVEAESEHTPLRSLNRLRPMLNRLRPMDANA